MYQSGYNTAAVQEAQPNRLYTRLQCVSIKLSFTRQPFQNSDIYTWLPCVHVKSLFTRQPFKSQIGCIHVAGCIQKLLFTRQLFQSKFRYIHGCRVITSNHPSHGSHSRAKSAIYIFAGCIHKIVFYTAVVQEPIKNTFS